MGFFSWKTSDTEKSISNRYSDRGALPVYVLCPDGSKIYEPNYEGYGEFGGRDMYALVAQWNFPEKCKDENGNWLSDGKCRNLGIDIACYDRQNEALKYPIKIVENKHWGYDDVGPATMCLDQGFFYGEDEED
jgi:hypothetical protein